MSVKVLERKWYHRILGIPATRGPGNPGCWSYSDGTLRIDLKGAFELKERGGALRFEGGGLPGRVLVVHGEDDQFRAFENRCTHLGHRRLDPVPGTNTVQCCSVNKSTYDVEGRKIFGPTPRPIAVYPARMEGDHLIVSVA